MPAKTDIATLSRIPHLSRMVLGGGLALLLVLWSLYGWVTVSEHAASRTEVQDHLADVAAAYGEHASTLMQNVVPIRVAGAAGGHSQPGAVAAGEKALAQFRAALDIPRIALSIVKDGPRT